MNTCQVVRAALSLGFRIQGWPSLKQGQEALCFVVARYCRPGGSAAPAGLVFLLWESWESMIKGSDSLLPPHPDSLQVLPDTSQVCGSRGLLAPPPGRTEFPGPWQEGLWGWVGLGCSLRVGVSVSSAGTGRGWVRLGQVTTLG